MLEDDLHEAYKAAHYGLQKAVEEYERANTALFEAKRCHERAWNAYLREVTRDSLTKPGSPT